MFRRKKTGGGCGVARAALAATGMLGAAALGSCSGTGPANVAAEATPAKASLPADVPAPSAAEIYGAAKTDRQAAAAPPAEAAKPKPAAPGVDEPRKLVGLGRAQIEALLGQPAMQRREAAAELWQYRAANCVLDLFLYAAPDGQLRVTHADLRGRREGRPAPPGCFAEIAGASGRPQTANN